MSKYLIMPKICICICLVSRIYFLSTHKCKLHNVTAEFLRNTKSECLIILLTESKDNLLSPLSI